MNTLRHYRRDSWFRYFKITRDEFERLMVAVSEALDGEPITRDQLARRVGEITGSPDQGDRLRESWGAAPAGVLSGKAPLRPNNGRNVRFTRPDRWLRLATAPRPTTGPGLDHSQVPGAAYGPATREDYARWWGITPATAGKLIAALGEEVTELDVDGIEARLLADDVDELRSPKPARSVRLLPAFDPYVIGSTSPRRQSDAGRPQGPRPPPSGWVCHPCCSSTAAWTAFGVYSERGVVCESRSSPS